MNLSQIQGYFWAPRSGRSFSTYVRRKLTKLIDSIEEVENQTKMKLEVKNTQEIPNPSLHHAGKANIDSCTVCRGVD